MTLRNLAVIGALSCLTGCNAHLKEISTAAQDTVQYSLKNTVTLALLGTAAYYTIDPLAPNWEVSQKQVSDTRYRIDLRMKRFHAGGEGETSPLFERHAEELTENLGFPRYRLVSYSEGIDSETLGPRRWARGVIEMVSDPKPAKPAKRERLAKY